MVRVGKIFLQFGTLTGVGLGGWFAGKHFERLNDEKDDSIFLNVNIKRKPCLPIFGTVSAASPIVTANDHANMGAKLSVPGSRITQVSVIKKKVCLNITYSKVCCLKKKTTLTRLLKFFTLENVSFFC